MRACELDSALGGDPSFEVLKRGGLHLIVTAEVVPVGGGADNKKEFLCCSAFEWGAKKGLEFKVACLSVSITVCSNSLL